MKFEWDEVKNLSNLKKHGIEFKTAARVFDDPNISLRIDSYQHEERWNAIGLAERILFVVFLINENDSIRIISARRATRGEINEYRKNVFK